MTVQKIRPYLWFNDNAEEAIEFYVSLFDDSRVVKLVRGPDDRVVVGEFQLEGQQFLALNGGPMYQFNEAISLFVTCATQEEVDTLWARLTADGGEPGRCGWLKDRFGVSWQVIPRRLLEMTSSPDRAAAGRAMEAMLQMVKIDIAKLEEAYAGGTT
jgi:predicted 3-demethylubiquinone-9 3-methyltransferase (glyoxalase superfamily)